MAIPITVPRLGWSMEEGTFVEWLKRDGDVVRAGEPLFVLESEKASEPVEAIDSGVLRLTAESPKAGELVKVGQALAYFAAEGEILHPSPPASGGQGMGVRGVVETRDMPTPLTPTPLPPKRGERGLISTPRARRVAQELQIDVGNIVGTGRGGRVRERDVRAAMHPSSGKLIPHSRTRRIIAARTVAGVTVAAPVTLHTKVDATELARWRDRLEPKPSFTDLIVHLTVAALREHPMLQAQWRDDGLWVPDRINMAIGVHREQGLLAPVLHSAEQMTLNQRVFRLQRLIESARAGRLTAEEQRDATFTVTNLGMYGVDEFTPIITLPQCAVLGIGRIADGKLTLSLTFDHRVVDGAPAARFLQSLCALIARGES